MLTPAFSMPPGWLTGFMNFAPPAWASTTVVNVGTPELNGFPSVCRDKADAAFISIAAGTIIPVTITSNGVAAGNDSFTGPGTISSSASTVTGTSTTFLTSFAPGGVPRTLTGTTTTSGTAGTGTGTRYLSELKVNDLVGTAANGYSRVSAVASDLAFATSAAIPGGNLSGATALCIEQPTGKFGSNGVTQIATIPSNTSLTTVTAQGTIGAGATYTIGNPVLAVAAATGAFFPQVWIAKGGSGTTAYFSTQRTTPFGVTGYTTSVRRRGAVRLATDGTIVKFRATGRNNTLSVNIETVYDTLAAVNPGTAIAWTDIVWNGYLPPNATRIRTCCQLSATISVAMYLRTRNLRTDSTLNSQQFLALATVSAASTVSSFDTACDGALGTQYTHSTAPTGGGTYIVPSGYDEDV